jgi:hypothetical protein
LTHGIGRFRQVVLAVERKERRIFLTKRRDKLLSKACTIGTDEIFQINKTELSKRRPSKTFGHSQSIMLKALKPVLCFSQNDVSLTFKKETLRQHS